GAHPVRSRPTAQPHLERAVGRACTRLRIVEPLGRIARRTTECLSKLLASFRSQDDAHVSPRDGPRVCRESALPARVRLFRLGPAWPVRSEPPRAAAWPRRATLLRSQPPTDHRRCCQPKWRQARRAGPRATPSRCPGCSALKCPKRRQDTAGLVGRRVAIVAASLTPRSPFRRTGPAGRYRDEPPTARVEPPESLADWPTSVGQLKQPASSACVPARENHDRRARPAAPDRPR